MINISKFLKSYAVYVLLIFTPIAVILELLHVGYVTLFVITAIAIIPLAKLIGDSTEHLSTHYGSTLGSLINVTFGNAAEIIIAVVAINAGLLELVKASITGSILGNIMLIFGLSMIAGGLRQKEQLFNKENAGLQSSLIFLALIGLAIPTIMSITILNADSEGQAKIQILSDSVAILLLFVYVVGIVFTFFTHKYLFVSPYSNASENKIKQSQSLEQKEIVFYVGSMIGVIVVSEILVGSVEKTSKEFGFGEMFVGAIIVGIGGNAAEHSSAIVLARKGKMGLSIGIAAGSGTQIALFVVPILVLVGIVLGQPFTLQFTLYELATLFLAAIIMNLIAFDGKSNWFEGVMLTSVYIIIAIGFFFIG